MSDEHAFPTQMWDEELKEATWLDGGLTKREIFAMAALQGLLANAYVQEQANSGARYAGRSIPVSNAEMAVRAADALLAELEREDEA